MNESNKQTAELLLAHFQRYPLAQIPDLLKLLFQQEFGCGHFVSDEEKNLARLRKEFSDLSCTSREEAVEPIGNDFARLHLRVLSQTSLRMSTLSRLFTLSANQAAGSKEGFLKKAGILRALCQEGRLPFPDSQVDLFLTQWETDGGGPFSHTEAFRQAYGPAYRVISRRFCRFLPLFSRIDQLLKSHPHVAIAIDGDSGAGKSTLAGLLKEVYDCQVVHMDHFFLRPGQRTRDRLQEAGGNIDYERFSETVLPHLGTSVPITYRPFDCQTGQLGAEIRLEPKRLTVVEGVYSHHPLFEDAYHLKIFFFVDEAQQLGRIFARNGERMLNRFKDEWIPMEKHYFDTFAIKENSELAFHT